MTQLNIVYLFTDQLRGDSLGFSSDGEVITPNIDRLAAQSTRFNRCISNSPLCVPARASLMIGMLPRESGVWSNRKGASLAAPSHVRNIRDAGYHTAVIGKTHLWRISAGPKPGMHAREMDEILERWGYDYRVEVNDPIGTGSMGCAYTDFLEKNGWLEPHQQYIRNWIAELRAGNPTPWAQEPSPVPTNADIDSFIGRAAAEWLETVACSRPFYLQVQFTGPHDPYDGPRRFRDCYEASTLSIGVTGTPKNGALDRVNARSGFPNSIARATESQRQHWRVNHYANISLIDAWIGNIMRVLDSRGLLSNTWIVLTSDHGEMLRELGLIGKTFYYEPSMHVPCLIRAPTDLSKSVDQLVEHVDIPTTLLEIAGAQPFENTTGRSLLPCVTNFNEYRHKEFVVSKLFGETTIVTARYKLTVNAQDTRPMQLLDRDQDPDELTNLVNESSHRNQVDDLVGIVETIDARLNQSELAEYRDYVDQTGRLN